MRQACGVTGDKKLSAVLGITYSAITAARKRGAIPPAWYVTIAEKFDVSMDWLRTGEEEPLRGGTRFANVTQTRELMHGRTPETRRIQWNDGAPAEPDTAQQTIYNDNEEEDFDLAEVLAQTLDILKSKTVYTTAIVSNIKAFHKAITTEKKIDEMQGQLNQALSSFQDQLDKTNQLVQGLQSENAQLRHDLEESRAASAIRDTG
jgi:hypothetical protein